MVRYKGDRKSNQANEKSEGRRGTDEAGVIPAEGRRPAFIESLKEGRRGDCREALNTQDPRPPAGTVSQGQERKLECLEMKMIGKPYAGEPQVRFDEGEQDCIPWTILNGHEVGNDRHGQGSAYRMLRLFSTLPATGPAKGE